MPDLAAFLRRAGPEGWLARALSLPSSTTADLYLRNACADFLAEGRIRAEAPTVFRAGGVEIVMRHDGRARPRLGRRRLVYLMDDLWRPEGGAGLPAGYRAKARLLEARAARWHLARAADVVVSSAALAAAAAEDAPRARIHRLDPYWSEPLADLAHFDRPGLDIACLGARTHARDIATHLPMLLALLEELPDATLTVSAELPLPPRLAAHPRLGRIRATAWADYRAALPGLRFHLALYPLEPTPFNAARSVNKLIEHAIVGAPTLLPAHWETGRAAAAAGAALALGEAPGDWAAAIRALHADRARLRALAAAALAHARAINRAEPQRALWSRLIAAAGPAGNEQSYG